MKIASEQKVQFGSKEIVFELFYEARKSLGITVHPDRSVTVRAPLDTPVARVLEVIRKRSPWILKQQSYFLSFEPLTPARKYLSGETHLYLGRQYRLKIFDATQEKVTLKGGFIEVHTRNRSKTKELVWEWYKKHAELKFREIAAPWILRFKRYGVEPSQFVVKQMDMRWGSCTPKGKIILNTELIKAPKGCIEYVIVHELCHLVHHNHSAAFFELQTKEMADWVKWKERLERVLA
ncbi:MAG: M48 family metallopeptidase [Chitinophagales bacterium]|nr:M48 family metallopeptidase [Chitinophagales bacterium]